MLFKSRRSQSRDSYQDLGKELAGIMADIAEQAEAKGIPTQQKASVTYPACFGPEQFNRSVEAAIKEVGGVRNHFVILNEAYVDLTLKTWLDDEDVALFFDDGGTVTGRYRIKIAGKDPHGAGRAIADAIARDIQSALQTAKTD